MNDLQWGFVFKKENCIQCHACETACKSWRSLEPRIRWRRVVNVWTGEYPKISNSTAVVSCLHCDDPACIKSCSAGAITKRAADGVVLVDRNRCSGCGACAKACPYGVPQFGSDGIMQKCDFCQAEKETYMQHHLPCVIACPTKALESRKMGPEEKRAGEQAMLDLLVAGQRLLSGDMNPPG